MAEVLSIIGTASDFWQFLTSLRGVSGANVIAAQFKWDATKVDGSEKMVVHKHLPLYFSPFSRVPNCEGKSTGRQSEPEPDHIRRTQAKDGLLFRRLTASRTAGDGEYGRRKAIPPS